MADGKLILVRPYDGTGRLVLGDDGGAVAAPAASISVDGQFPDDMACTVQLLWDANVSRGEAPRTKMHWQAAAAAQPASACSTWQNSVPVSARSAFRWQRGEVTIGAARARWQDSQRLTSRAASRWQSGDGLRGSSSCAWQESERLRHALGARWQVGDVQRQVLLTKYQEAIRLRQAAASGWQNAVPRSTRIEHRGRAGASVHLGMNFRWQDARRPPAGQSVVVVPVNPGPAPCYDPATLGRLELSEAWANDGRLVLVCKTADIPAGVVIPVRSIYVVHNNVTLARLPSGAEFLASTFSLDIDADSWTFGWSASLHASARPHLARNASGDLAEVQCIVNGVTLHLVVDSVGRDRQFPTQKINVRGRGRAALLGDDVQTFRNTSQRTAQQLMLDVLTVNGASIGWTVDWGITDWIVPAGAWVHQGSYISALQDIAGAAGAYIQPHLTDKVLRVLPRYPKAPWDWSTLLTPALELPVDVTTTEGIDEIDRPDYNRVFVGGVGMGVFGPVTRAGTAGDKVAPQVIHPLITAADVHRQAGLAVLADTGRQERVSLQTLVLPEMGIVMPGKVVRYVSDDGTRLGLVRRTSISMQSWPQMHQNLEVQTYVE